MKRSGLLEFQDQATGNSQDVHLETEDVTVQVRGSLADVYAAALQKVYSKDPDAVAAEDANTSGSYANSFAMQFANAAKNFLDDNDESPVEKMVIVGGDIESQDEVIEVAASATQNAPETTVYFINEDGFQETKTSLESLTTVLKHIGFRTVRF